MTASSPPALSDNARLVLESRYLQRDDQGRLIETPAQLFRRVADNVARAERAYGRDAAAFADQAYALMTRLEFLPNSPTLMNAGLGIQQLAACFVLPVEDSLPSIFDALKYTALIHQSGGGTGFAFSRLRPANDIVHSTHGVASGPISFMEVFDAATDAIKQGGTRRGANMAILSVDHPDIEAFVRAKADRQSLTNFNLSVAVTDAFMEAVEADGEIQLVNPRSGAAAGVRKARALFALIVEQAWEHGDPGLVFLDRINAANPTPQLGPIESTNPCGEQPLLPYESCTLGSLNVAKFVRDGDLDWERLGGAVETAVRFLDNVIDQNHYPAPQIERATKSTRKIGLGVMGFADLLCHLRVAYDSDEGLAWAARLMGFIQERAQGASQELGAERGVFPAWEGSIFGPEGPRYRNATRTTIAPTGTISIIADCSSGIEPVFAFALVRRHYLDREHRDRLVELPEMHEGLRAVAAAEGWWSDDLLRHLQQHGSLRAWGGAPEWARRVYVAAHEISAEWHVRMQAVFQDHIDNAVAKTINLPADASPADAADAYRLAWRENCKGITIYRHTARDKQVLSLAAPEADWR